MTERHGLQAPRRVTALESSKFRKVMSFKFHPTIVRIDNESSVVIWVADHEVTAGRIIVDDEYHAIRIAATSSAIPALNFDQNELWVYTPDGDAILKVISTDSTDMVELLKLTSGI